MQKNGARDCLASSIPDFPRVCGFAIFWFFTGLGVHLFKIEISDFPNSDVCDYKQSMNWKHLAHSRFGFF